MTITSSADDEAKNQRKPGVGSSAEQAQHMKSVFGNYPLQSAHLQQSARVDDGCYDEIYALGEQPTNRRSNRFISF